MVRQAATDCSDQRKGSPERQMLCMTLCCKASGTLRWKARARGRVVSDFKGRHFGGEIVLWAVRWYCRYGISYRDLEQMSRRSKCAMAPNTWNTSSPAAEPPALMGAILADATNLGLDRMAESSRGITIHQLNLMIDRHIRPDTYAAAVAAIADAQHRSPFRDLGAR